jgi:radical SAM protein with 4Fe4S-binding SPASM domain
LENVIIIFVLLATVSLSLFYIIREKKRGAKCIGCPYAKSCGGKCGNSQGNNK